MNDESDNEHLRLQRHRFIERLHKMQGLNLAIQSISAKNSKGMKVYCKRIKKYRNIQNQGPSTKQRIHHSYKNIDYCGNENSESGEAPVGFRYFPRLKLHSTTHKMLRAPSRRLRKPSKSPSDSSISSSEPNRFKDTTKECLYRPDQCKTESISSSGARKVETLYEEVNFEIKRPDRDHKQKQKPAKIKDRLKQTLTDFGRDKNENEKTTTVEESISELKTESSGTDDTKETKDLPKIKKVHDSLANIRKYIRDLKTESSGTDDTKETKDLPKIKKSHDSLADIRKYIRDKPKIKNEQRKIRRRQNSEALRQKPPPSDGKEVDEKTTSVAETSSASGTDSSRNAESSSKLEKDDDEQDIKNAALDKPEVETSEERISDNVGQTLKPDDKSKEENLTTEEETSSEEPNIKHKKSSKGLKETEDKEMSTNEEKTNSDSSTDYLSGESHSKLADKDESDKNPEKSAESEPEDAKQKRHVFGKTNKPSLTEGSEEEIMEIIPETNEEGLVPNSLMFRDGLRQIDMVLAYKDGSGTTKEKDKALKNEARNREYRRIFQHNLLNDGLELELEHKDLSFDKKTWFLKIHLSKETEQAMAKVTGMKRFAKQFSPHYVTTEKDEILKKESKIQRWFSKWHGRWFPKWLARWLPKWLARWEKVRTHPTVLTEPEPSFYAPMEHKGMLREEQFLVKERHTEYFPSQRSYFVKQILNHTRYDNTSTTKMGISSLICYGAYEAFYPLHEGQINKELPKGPLTDRQLLHLEWAQLTNWRKKQPLWLVRQYFGERVALYFCWLGFYTSMLFAPAIVGVLCFLYGLLSTGSNYYVPAAEICNKRGTGGTLMCPTCRNDCDYWVLSQGCIVARVGYLVDNPIMLFFSLFMAFWATIYLEFWKRKQNILRWEWDLGYLDQYAQTRTEFETTVHTTRLNPVTGETEKYMPTSEKAVRYVASVAVILFMICLVFVAVLGTTSYRVVVASPIKLSGNHPVKMNPKIVNTVIAAGLNLIRIEIFTKLFAKIAKSLTNLENPRTQAEYEDSYIYKIYIFEFFNLYSSTIYLAFFKGHFYDYPGAHEVGESVLIRLRTDICDPVGCMPELCIQLAVIMTGRQVMTQILEMGFPKLRAWWRKKKLRAATVNTKKPLMAWELDYHLVDSSHIALHSLYFEMILTYGFVILFVAAFPLSPLFALVNNIIGIRMDAYKLLAMARRPVTRRVDGIGAWYGILQGVTFLSVASNAFVISYSSDFVPRMVYKFMYSPDATLTGYMNHSLSLFDTSDYKPGMGWQPNSPTRCWYRGYRNPPNHAIPYGLSRYYWHVFAARLAFIVVFENATVVTSRSSIKSNSQTSFGFLPQPFYSTVQYHTNYFGNEK